MSIDVALHHLTRYRFDRRVGLSPHVVRLRPAPHCRTPIKAYSLRIEPAGHFINWQQDPFGNYLARIVFPEPATLLSIEVDLVADLTVINPFDFFLDEEAAHYGFTYDADTRRDLVPYLEIREQGPRLQAWLAAVDRAPLPTIDFLVMLNQRLQQDIAYSVRMEPGVQTCEESLERRIGSCRDSAWLLVQVLRHLGLAARFVSGYLVQLVADQKALDGPSGPAADFTDLHAWAEVYLPGAGWVGMDPTSGLFAGEGHIPLACTPSPSAAAPVTGFTDRCEVEFEFANTVTRVREDPRVTRPFDDATWAAVDALGRQVDARLAQGDVRLTQGGEPTFVSIDDPDGAEWNTAADGAAKRRLATRLVRRMRDAFAPGGVLHFGQGKWYPGEPLPRWAFNCWWRRDGVPVWSDAGLLAASGEDLGHTVADARRLADALCRELGFPAGLLMPAHEDVAWLLWREARLPVNVDARAAALDDDDERQRLARLLDAGLDTPAGYVMPLQWSARDGGFFTSAWPLRRERLVLAPGDSALGMRLPLDSLPWVPDGERPLPDQPADPFDPASGSGNAGLQRSVAVPSVPGARSGVRQRRDQVVHTALAIEARDGAVHVFLPPLAGLDGWLALLAAIEAAARSSGVRIVLEGYEPPGEGRLGHFAVTPDPGVIEVNIHPATHWDELVARSERLYEIARETRLATEKFMLDGRHTGTGGGNHVTLGGLTPADSPFLRRPALLRSLLTFWQNHPGLSYLFSGLFVGPTSQAPRVDEARDDRLHELEIAFAQLPDGDCATPWLVDRALRHLLTDMTGNTHRAEFCIDKMYSPDGPAGRRGLLEFRAFEMPPHPRMALVQMLLLRAIVAMTWDRPLKRPLVRWGTALHDRFMLPHFVWTDVVDAIGEIQAAGLPFDPEWLAAFLEFRFPRYGTVQVGDVAIELRAAIEPWNVLGEEVTSSGTARFVDSSVERLQVRVTGATPGRHVVACNGRRVPLVPTGRFGEAVAGVRYQAWQPPSSLHPTIRPHAPLVFDLIDTWTGRAVGGCTYHVSHSGGRNYEAFPVNANSAEARRVARFDNFGHTPGDAGWQDAPRGQRSDRFEPRRDGPRPMAPPPEEPDGGMPLTLDLRRPR